MTESTDERTDQHQMHCPTCNALQSPSDECRRCKCDLSLVRRCRRTAETERRRCLGRLREGRPQQALDHAHRFAELAGSVAAARLLATCLVFCDRWDEAFAVAVHCEL